MNRSFEIDDEIDSLTRLDAEPNLGAEPGARILPGSATAFTDGSRDCLVHHANLGANLSQITSQLVQQLATGTERTADGGVFAAVSIRRDTRGNRVPRDESQLVSWKHVAALSGSEMLLALVSLPDPRVTTRV